MPSVSVIIPTWNRRETLERAVQSALDQTVVPQEVLVCDDGSTDDSKRTVEAIGDPRVRWVEGPRGGRPAIPRNRGIRESSGEWLAFLDSDDEWMRDKLARQLAMAQGSGCRAVCTNAERFIPARGVAGNLLSIGKGRLGFDDLLRVNSVICSSALLHRSLLPLVIGFPEDERLKALEDYALWLRVATQTDFAYLQEPLVLYRDDAANSVRSEDTDVRKQRELVFSDFKRWAAGRDIPNGFVRKLRLLQARDDLRSGLRLVRNLFRTGGQGRP